MKMLIPLQLMITRASRYGSESDTTLFTEYLHAGEFALRLTAASFVSAIDNDRANQRYKLIHDLVRADGVGDWARTIDETLTGVPSQQLSNAFFDARRALTERVSKSSWQFEAVRDLQDVLEGINPEAQKIPDRVALRSWFQIFVEIRNKTKGHGAILPSYCSKFAHKLVNSVNLIYQNNPVFLMPWAYIHRNFSGKYRIINLGGDTNAFSKLKTSDAISGENYADGVYIAGGKLRKVDLLYSDLDVSDFYFPNGAFKKESFELHSLITDGRLKGDATPYLIAAGGRPESETQGQGQLDVIGRVFSNIPARPASYIRRPKLEADVKEAIINDRHPIVTLVGRGGIGKTSLALIVLREIAETDRFDVIVWFSARDIDLTVSGIKPVQPRVLTDREISDEYSKLVSGDKVQPSEKSNSIDFMAEHLRKSPLGPTLYVFDNFETVRSPIDLFQWIDMNIRLPNKAVITSRFREFKADFPIEISGMEQLEAESLVDQMAGLLRIEPLIGRKERSQIIEESNGHPYVIKIIMGEIADKGSFSKPTNIISRREDMLDALFERTYANLSPLAARIFITLSGWKSLVPQLAVEAMLLRHGNIDGNPSVDIDQLVRMSLIERRSAGDGTDFLEMPLAASLFGKRKLEVSPQRAIVESDIRFLQDVGPTVTAGLKEGVRPRFEEFFKKVARKINGIAETLDEFRPVLEFLAKGYPPAWMWLSAIEQETGGRDGISRAAECVRRFLETQPDHSLAADAWQRLVVLYRTSGDAIGGCSAFLKATSTNTAPLSEISSIANWLNTSTEAKDGIDLTDRQLLFKPLARLMEINLPDCSATDLSRLSWLYLHCGEIQRARDIADIGLKKDPQNIYCQRLVMKLTE